MNNIWCDEQFWLNWWHPVIMSFNVMQMVCFQKHLITGKDYTAYLQERAIQHIKIQLLAIHIIVVFCPTQNHSHGDVTNTGEGHQIYTYHRRPWLFLKCIITLSRLFVLEYRHRPSFRHTITPFT